MARRNGWGGYPTPGDYVQAKMLDGAQYAGGQIWQGMLKIASGGFGKGLLAVAAATIIGFALTLGVMAAAPGGLLATNIMTNQTANIVGFLPGATAGALHGVAVLMHPIGLAGLAVGGVFGALGEINKAKRSMTPQIAQAKAKEYEAARAQQPALSPALSLSAALDEPSMTQRYGKGFAAREEQRRVTQKSVQASV